MHVPLRDIHRKVWKWEEALTSEDSCRPGGCRQRDLKGEEDRESPEAGPWQMTDDRSCVTAQSFTSITHSASGGAPSLFMRNKTDTVQTHNHTYYYIFLCPHGRFDSGSVLILVHNAPVKRTGHARGGVNRKERARVPVRTGSTRSLAADGARLENEKMAKSKIRDFFSWSDDEVELLLKVTQEYKAAMAAQSIDWESSQSKYGDILERYREYYPSSQEAMATGKEFPHKKEELTKGMCASCHWDIRVVFINVSVWRKVHLERGEGVSGCLDVKAVFRHQLRRMSAESGRDFLRN